MSAYYIPGISLSTLEVAFFNPHEIGINITLILWTRKLRFEELRQLVHSHTAHLAHTTAGSTDHEEISREIFAEVHDILK